MLKAKEFIVKRKTEVLLTLLAALVLIFAGCDSSGDSASSGGGGSATPTDIGGNTLTAVPSGGLGYVVATDGSWSVYTEAGLLGWTEAVQKLLIKAKVKLA